MMKYVLILALVGVALSAPQSDVTIVRSDNDNQGDGTFNWAFETSDGSKQDQAGELQAGTLTGTPDGTPVEGQFQTVKGSYSYSDPTGKLITVTYEADDKGYRAKTTYA